MILLWDGQSFTSHSTKCLDTHDLVCVFYGLDEKVSI